MKTTPKSNNKKLIFMFICLFFQITTFAQTQKGADIDGEAADDNSGHSVSMPDANTVAIGAPWNDGKASGAGHVRIYTWSGSAWTQKGADIDGEAAGDYSGYSVSMPDANTVAIGADYNDGKATNAGHVRIYSWSCSAWTQKGADIDGEAAEDHSGISVSMPDANTVAIGAIGNDGKANNAGHVRIYTWSGSAWTQKGADIDGEAADDYSGISVSMPDANTVAIGAWSNDGTATDAGHVRIYTWSGSAWTQKGADIDGEAADDASGYSVSMPDANTVAIGAPVNDGTASGAGHVRIYSWSGSAWTQKGADIDGEAIYDESGYSVSMPDANTVAIGAPWNDGTASDVGHVRIYTLSGSAWTQKGADIHGEAADDRSGWSVSMPDANTVAIGATGNDGTATNAGHVRIYSWSGSAWTQKGADIDGEAAYDNSGYSVSMPDANTVAIGAPENSGKATDAGHVRIYTWSGSAWTQKGADIDGELQADRSGYSVSMPDANTVAIGAWSNDGTATDAGHVRIYTWSCSAWTQKGADIDGEAAWDYSGISVSMPDANTVAIGAPWNDGTATDAGHVRIYTWSGSAWTQKGADIDGEASDDRSGWSVSMPDANTVAIGATGNDGTASGAGHVRIYTWSGSAWTQKGADIDGEAAGDQSGWSVSMPDAYTVAIGAKYNDGTAGTAGNTGHVRVYKLCKNTTKTIAKTACYSYVSPSKKYTYTKSGTYYDIIPSANGCDSVITINLTINNQTTKTIAKTACYSYVSPSKKYTYTKSDTYYDTIPNANGCDSVITIKLTINKTTGETIARTACYSYVSPSKKYTYTKSGNYYDTIPNANGCDSVITINLTINKTTGETIARTACYSYVSPSKKYTYTKSGNYYDTIPNANGCDSVITINLTINSADVSVTNSSPTLTANATGATYQWLDCDKNFTEINNANNQTFLATSNGNYAVEVTQNGCIDTSLCINVSNAQILENTFGNHLKVFPNPTKGEVTIKLGNRYNEVSVIIRNALGQEVMRTSFNKTNAFKLNIPGETGLYILELHAPEHKALLRVVKN